MVQPARGAESRQDQLHDEGSADQILFRADGRELDSSHLGRKSLEAGRLLHPIHQRQPAVGAFCESLAADGFHPESSQSDLASSSAFSHDETSEMGGVVSEKSKPSIEEVLQYADEQIAYYLRYNSKHAKRFPKEHLEEAAQDARMRVVQKYQQMKPDAGWKSYTQRLVLGAILDYARGGDGYKETNWRIQGNAMKGSGAIGFRETGPKGDEPMMMEQIIDLGLFRPSSHTPASKVRMELLLRLCSQDDDLNMLTRYFFNEVPMHEIAKAFGVTRENVGQRIQSLLDRFNDPGRNSNPWTLQIIYALGLCEHFDVREVDQGYGWNLPIANLEARKPSPNSAGESQLDLFGALQ